MEGKEIIFMFGLTKPLLGSSGKGCYSKQKLWSLNVASDQILANNLRMDT